MKDIRDGERVLVEGFRDDTMPGYVNVATRDGTYLPVAAVDIYPHPRQEVAFTLRAGGRRENLNDWLYDGPERMETVAREVFAGALKDLDPGPKITYPTSNWQCRFEIEDNPDV